MTTPPLPPPPLPALHSSRLHTCLVKVGLLEGFKLDVIRLPANRHPHAEHHPEGQIEFSLFLFIARAQSIATALKTFRQHGRKTPPRDEAGAGGPSVRVCFRNE